MSDQARFKRVFKLIYELAVCVKGLANPIALVGIFNRYTWRIFTP